MAHIHTHSSHRSFWYSAINPQRWLARGKEYRRIKRGIDLLACVLSAPLIFPVGAVIALLIVLDSPGPIFFHQWRTGKGGRRFRMHKFRTMVSEAETLKPAIIYTNKLAWPDFKISADLRVTRIGRFLRRTSLDELPQWFNVLKGEMSLVGPRPMSFAPGRYLLWHTARLDALPGITGPSQISGRSQLDFDNRVRLDLEYIEHQGLWLDFCILLRTFGHILVGKGAY